jgi:DNA-binding transcriptional regulator YiaG
VKKFKSEAMQVIYEQAEEFFKDGIISKEEFHEYDDRLVSEPANVKSSRVPAPQYASPIA